MIDIFFDSIFDNPIVFNDLLSANPFEDAYLDSDNHWSESNFDDCSIEPIDIFSTPSIQQVDSVDCSYEGFSIENDYLPNREVSFGGQIDNLYDPDINRARDSYDEHMRQLSYGNLSSDQMKYHLDAANDAKRTENYWKDCKFEAELEHRKNEASNDYIDTIWNLYKF